MRRLLFYITFAVSAFSLSSCKEDLEIWDSETLAYSGRYCFQVKDSVGNVVIHDYSAKQILNIYNTADNKTNELWIQDEANVIPLKSKFYLDGNSSFFKSKSLNFNDLPNNENAIELPTPAPTALGQTKDIPTDRIRCGLSDGKVISNAATTLGGNKTDSLFLRIHLLRGQASFESYLVPVELRIDKTKEEFAWKLKTVTYDATNNEYFVIAGHRYTGFSEDKY